MLRSASFRSQQEQEMSIKTPPLPSFRKKRYESHISPSLLHDHTKRDIEKQQQGEEHPSSPKKNDIPSHRRRRPLIIMCLLLAAAFTTGGALYITHPRPNIVDVGSNDEYGPRRGQAMKSNDQAPMAEFTAPGLYLDIDNALDVAYPEQEEERRLLLPGTPLHPPSPDNTQPFLLVAITSACCSLTSLQRRNAIRSTWGALSKERYPTEIDIKFFLAQPPNTTIAVRWRTPLGEELSSLSASLTPPTPDLVIVRGKDTYKNLPNKTFRVMRYALAHPYNYSFVLKVDDDTHVRMHKVLQSLQELHLYQVSQRQITLEWMQGVKEELKKMSQEQHRAVISDGMGLFYSTQDTADGEHVVGDTIDGQQVTVNDLLLNITHEHEHEHALTPDGSNTSTTTTPITKQNAYPQSNVYMGCIEVRGGYRPIRDPGSKWYVSPTTLPDDSLPRGIEYLAGWGYLLSRDLVNHIVQKVNTYHDASSPHATTDTRSSVNTTHGPLWFYELPWEDVVVGFLLSNVVPRPLSHPAFRPAWRLCSPDTAVRHLDIDSPRLLAGLMEQDRSGLSDEKTVQCSSGEFLPGDYHGWWRWRQAQERFSSERVHGHRR